MSFEYDRAAPAITSPKTPFFAVEESLMSFAPAASTADGGQLGYSMVFTTIAAAVAVAWIFYRLSALRQIPIPTLITLLGYDLPSPPRVSISGIEQDSVTLNWSLPEKPNSVSKHLIQIDGVTVGESYKKGTASVTVTGLNPDHVYNIRVIAANQQNFQAPGPLIRLRTRRAGQASDRSGTPTGTQTIGNEEIPVLQPTSQEPSSPLPRTRRDRRSKEQSSTSQAQDATTTSDGRNVHQLTAELEDVRRELGELERQLHCMEEEHKIAESALLAELESFKERKKNEDQIRQQLKAETRILEESKRAIEANRTKTEKQLKAKEIEISELHDEALRWDEERDALRQRLDVLSKDALEAEERAISLEESSRRNIEEQQSSIARLEEEIRSLIASIKAESEKPLVHSNNGYALEGPQDSDILEYEWQNKQRALEMRLTRARKTYQAAEEEYYRSVKQIEFWQARRSSAPSISVESPPVKKSKHRRNRNRKSRSHTVSNSSQTALSTSDQPEVSTSYSGNAQARNNSLAVPFIGNGVPAPMNYGNDIPLGMDDFNDEFSLDAPMSPTANLLLPSNLFSTDDNPPSPKSKRNSVAESMNLPQSPSSDSPGTSVFSSPQSSFQHIPLYPSVPDSLTSTSMALTPATPAVSQPKKFAMANLFSGLTGRPRGKTLGGDGPVLGSIKASESQSFPRENNMPNLAPIGTGRRKSGSSTSNWATSFMDSKRGIVRNENGNASVSRIFNPFNPKYDPLEPSKILEPVSPRPSSVASYDNVLPMPSSDASAAFGWPTQMNDNLFNHRKLLASPWSAFGNGPASLSANASVASLSMNGTMHGDGQRWAYSRPVTPKLNPAAPAFEANIDSLNAKEASSSPKVRPRQSIKSIDYSASQDSLSMHTTASSLPSTAGSSFAGPILDTTSSRDSGLFSRLPVPRKGSTSKFNIGWKNFGRKKDASGASETGDDTDPEGQLTLASPPTSAPASTPSKMGNFFTRKKDQASASETGDDADKDKDNSIEATRPTTPSAAASLWPIKEGVFFGRKKDADKDKDKDKEKEKEKDRHGEPKSETDDSKAANVEMSSSPAKMDVGRLFSIARKDKDKDRENKEKDKDSDKKDKDAEKALKSEHAREQRERDKQKKRDKKREKEEKKAAAKKNEKKGKEKDVDGRRASEESSKRRVSEDGEGEVSFTSGLSFSASGRELPAVAE